jgi:hypothetical protein
MIVVLSVMSDMDLSEYKPTCGFGWLGSIGVSESSWFGSWYAAGVKPVCMVWLQVRHR